MLLRCLLLGVGRDVRRPGRAPDVLLREPEGAPPARGVTVGSGVQRRVRGADRTLRITVTLLRRPSAHLRSNISHREKVSQAGLVLGSATEVGFLIDPHQTQTTARLQTKHSWKTRTGSFGLSKNGEE